MTGAWHYTEAETDLQNAWEFHNDGRADLEAYYLRSAQVHATLALAAATAMNDAEGGMGRQDWSAWHDVCAVKEPKPEVTG